MKRLKKSEQASKKGGINVTWERWCEDGTAGLLLAILAALVVGTCGLSLVAGSSIMGRWFSMVDGVIFLVIVALGVAGACVMLFGERPERGLMMIAAAVGLFLLWQEVM